MFVCMTQVAMAVCHTVLSVLYRVYVLHTLPVTQWAHVCLVGVLHVLRVGEAQVFRVVWLLCPLAKLYMEVVQHVLHVVHVLYMLQVMLREESSLEASGACVYHELHICGVEPVVSVLRMAHLEHTLTVSHCAHMRMVIVFHVLSVRMTQMLRVVCLLSSFGRLYMMYMLCMEVEQHMVHVVHVLRMSQLLFPTES